VWQLSETAFPPFFFFFSPLLSPAFPPLKRRMTKTNGALPPLPLWGGKTGTLVVAHADGRLYPPLFFPLFSLPLRLYSPCREGNRIRGLWDGLTTVLHPFFFFLLLLFPWFAFPLWKTRGRRSQPRGITYFPPLLFFFFFLSLLLSFPPFIMKEEPLFPPPFLGRSCRGRSDNYYSGSPTFFFFPLFFLLSFLFFLRSQFGKR